MPLPFTVKVSFAIGTTATGWSSTLQIRILLFRCKCEAVVVHVNVLLVKEVFGFIGYSGMWTFSLDGISLKEVNWRCGAGWAVHEHVYVTFSPSRGMVGVWTIWGVLGTAKDRNEQYHRTWQRTVYTCLLFGLHSWPGNDRYFYYLQHLLHLKELVLS